MAIVILGGSVMLTLTIAAGFDLTSARLNYLRLAMFHGPLEVAACVFWWLERRPLLRAG